MQIQVFPALFLVRKRHNTCSQWVQVQHKQFRTPKLMSDVPIYVPERLELITAHLTPTHLLPSPLFLQAFVTIPPPPSHPELICAPHSHSILNMANSIQAVEGERPWSGNGEVGKSWVRAEQLQCYSKMTSTPASFCSWEPQGNQESLRASVLYRRVTYCSQNPFGSVLSEPVDPLEAASVWPKWGIPRFG